MSESGKTISDKVAVVESNLTNGYPRYSDTEMRRRFERIQALASDADLAAVLICGAGYLDSPIQYLSNWPSRTSSFILLRNDGSQEMHIRLWNHLPNARDISVIADIRYGGDTHGEMLSRVGDSLLKAGVRNRRVGLIGRFDYWDVEYFVGQTGCQPISLNTEFAALRREKSDEELTYVRAASEMGDRALAAVRSALKPGLLEYELQKIVQDAYIGTRAKPIINFFLSTPMSDPDRCVPRQYLSNRRIEAGDVLATEISAWYWGYSGQVLRTFTLGGGPTEQFARLHEVALNTYQTLRDLCVPGTTVGELLDAADLIDGAGFTIWDDLIHGYGGGGYISPVLRTNQTGGADSDRDLALEKNWVVIVQPNVITRDERAGVQVGNGLVVREGSPEVLQEYPTDLVVCE